MEARLFLQRPLWLGQVRKGLSRCLLRPDLLWLWLSQSGPFSEAHMGLQHTGPGPIMTPAHTSGCPSSPPLQLHTPPSPRLASSVSHLHGTPKHSRACLLLLWQTHSLIIPPTFLGRLPLSLLDKDLRAKGCRKLPVCSGFMAPRLIFVY